MKYPTCLGAWRIELHHSFFLHSELNWACLWGAHNYSVLPFSNHWNICTHKHKLSTEPSDSAQLCYRGYKAHSRHSFLPKASRFLSSKHKSFWPLLCPILTADLEGGTRGLIKKEQCLHKNIGCQWANCLRGTVITVLPHTLILNWKNRYSVPLNREEHSY